MNAATRVGGVTLRDDGSSGYAEVRRSRAEAVVWPAQMSRLGSAMAGRAVVLQLSVSHCGATVMPPVDRSGALGDDVRGDPERRSGSVVGNGGESHRQIAWCGGHDSFAPGCGDR